MKMIGFILAALAALAGSLVAVYDKAEVNWPVFGIMMMTGIIGIVMARRAEHAEKTSGTRLQTNMRELNTSLSSIVDNLAALEIKKGDMMPRMIRDHIDATFPDDILTFVEARETITHLYGLQEYADVMSHFAAGERYLNRVWSASADGYLHEAQKYVTRSHEQFVAARERLQNLNA